MSGHQMLADLSIDAENRVEPPVLRAPAADGHKHDRGHVAVLSGPALATGAARLSAQAALSTGAGLVTIYGEREALREHAAHVTAIMLDDEASLRDKQGRRIDAFVVGPGHGGGDRTRALVLELLGRETPIVLDADALTAFAQQPEQLFHHLHDGAVLTPHAGEFARLFGTVEGEYRFQACRNAAERSGAVVVLKGNETLIAAPGDRWARNGHASPWLATAGAGDVLAGIIAAFLAQGSDPFDVACAAVWLHGDLGLRHGPGLTADRMIDHLPQIIAGRLGSD